MFCVTPKFSFLLACLLVLFFLLFNLRLENEDVEKKELSTYLMHLENEIRRKYVE